MSGYAVIDLETTGLSPAKHDRIVEVAVVHTDSAGTVEDEWCTLVNPKRDLGAQRIHHITAAEVRDAPTFDVVAPFLAGRLEGRVLVAHNIAFDGRFLAAAFRRVGVAAPMAPPFGVCTMRLAARFLPGSARALPACCAAAGVRHNDAHSALGDARAAAGLLARFLAAAGQPPPWQGLCREADDLVWPAGASRAFVPAQRGTAAAAAEPGRWLDRLVSRLPRVPEPPAADDYLEVLDGSLLDRRLSLSEKDALVELATHLDLSREDVARLHRDYLVALGAAALADGVVTETERRDLEQVATLLGLGGTDVDTALTRAGAEDPARLARVSHVSPGDEVAFTGEMNTPRDEWIARARAAGLSASASGVTKRTRLLVAADPDSLSGKARKARSYGVPIVGEDAFASMIAAVLGSVPEQSRQEAREPGSAL